MYLPAVNSPDSLLFALVYHKHLSAYQLIDKGSTLIILPITRGRAAIQRAADELKKGLILIALSQARGGS